jgi:hypothetical protein
MSEWNMVRDLCNFCQRNKRATREDSVPHNLLVGYIMYLVNSLIISHLEVENLRRKFEERITK